MLLDLQKELEALSFKDSLTGVANRRMFNSIMEVEWTNARRNNQPLSLILLDIDYFKQYNDHYGHVQGDQCLKRMGQVLTSAATRSRDFVARFGGEEFVLVPPETDEESGVAPGSLGVGTMVPAHADASIAFIEEMDKRLYRAKQNGRNCIVRGS